MILKYHDKGLHFQASLRRVLATSLISLLLAFATFLTMIFVFSKEVSGQTLQTKISVIDKERPSDAMIIGFVNGNRVKVAVNVSDVADPDGLAAFGFSVTYDPKLVTVLDVDGDQIADSGAVNVGPFLGSAGKQTTCNQGFLAAAENDPLKTKLTFSCVTPGSLPAAPTGSGELATINFTTGNIFGSGTLALSLTELVDNTLDANLIPHTATGIPLTIAKCADTNANKVVTSSDILYVILKFQTADPVADLDGSGVVTSRDILIAVLEFQRLCP